MPRRIDVRLGHHARRMRRKPTPQEARLWQRLRAGQLDGLRFTRQAVIGGIICDFACRDRALIVEVDGDTHDRARDADRDYALGRDGYRVLRFSNAEIGQSLDAVCERIVSIAQARPTKLERLGGVTRPPTPSLGREGKPC